MSDSSKSGIESGSRRRAPLPSSLVAPLRRAIRRRQHVLFVRGVLATVVVAIASLFAIMAVHATVTIFSTTARWLLTLGGLTATFTAAAWFIGRPLSQRVSVARIARVIETRHPELEERISSTVELLSSGDSQDRLGSRALIAELEKEAIRDVRVVNPRREFSFRSSRPYVIAASVAFFVLGAVAAVWPDQTRRLFLHGIVPSTNTGSLGAGHVQVTPGDVVLAPGDTLRVEAFVDSGPTRSCELLRGDGAGVEIVLPMSPIEMKGGLASRFALEVPAGKASFDYRVHTGDDVLTRSFRVTVTPRPDVARFDVLYEFPAYTGREPAVDADASGDLAAVGGTAATLTATFNKPIVSAALHIGERPIPGGELRRIDTEQRADWKIDLAPGLDAEWTLVLEDRHGLRGRAIRHSVKAIADSVPRVRVTLPETTDVHLRPDDRLRIEYEVRDDYGVGEAALLVQVGEAEPTLRVVDLPRVSALDDRLWIGRTALDLTRLELGSASHVRFQLRIEDSLPGSFGGPHVALTRSYIVTLDSGAKTFTDQWVDAKIQRLEASLKEALQELHHARGRSSWMRSEVPKEGLALSPAIHDAARVFRGHATKAEAVLYRVARDEVPREMRFVGDAAREVADRLVVPARRAGAAIRLADAKEEQNDHSKEADELTEKAVEAVQRILAALGGEADRVREALEIAKQADRLADELAWIPEDPGEAPQELIERVTDQLVESQTRIAADAADLARELEESLGKAAGPEPRSSAAVTQATAEHLSAAELTAALKTGREASVGFAELTDRFAPPPGAPPPGSPPAERAASEPAASEPGESFADLKERQDRVNDGIEAVDSGGLDDAIAALQRELAARAADLAAQARELGAGLDPGDPSKANTELAAEQFREAGDKAMEAAQLLAQLPFIPEGRYIPPKEVSGPQSPAENPSGDPDGGQGTKGGGSNTGAGSTKKPTPSNMNQNNTKGPSTSEGKAKLTAESQSAPPSSSPGKGSGTELTKEAEEAQRDGSLVLRNVPSPDSEGTGGFGGEPPPDAPPGEDGLGGAEMAGPPGMKPGEPGRSGKPSRGGGPGAKLRAGASRVAAKLRRLGISSDDWARLPRRLRNEILESADERAPQEYRALVRRYFRTLAKRGGEGS